MVNVGNTLRFFSKTFYITSEITLKNIYRDSAARPVSGQIDEWIYSMKKTITKVE